MTGPGGDPVQPGGRFRRVRIAELREPTRWEGLFSECAAAGVVERSMRSLEVFFLLVVRCLDEPDPVGAFHRFVTRGGWTAAELDPQGRLADRCFEAVYALYQREGGAPPLRVVEPPADAPEQLELFPAFLERHRPRPVLVAGGADEPS